MRRSSHIRGHVVYRYWALLSFYVNHVLIIVGLRILMLMVTISHHVVFWDLVLLSFYVKHVLSIVGPSDLDVHGYHYSFASCTIPWHHFQICALGPIVCMVTMFGLSMVLSKHLCPHK